MGFVQYSQDHHETGKEKKKEKKGQYTCEVKLDNEQEALAQNRNRVLFRSSMWKVILL